MKKKTILIIVALVSLIAINITLAVLYLTRDVNITGGVSVIGDMQVYEDDGVTVLTSIDFSNFTGGESEARTQDFFINNTGNQPLYVYWNISTSSIEWSTTDHQYRHYEDTDLKYTFVTHNGSDFWTPDSEARMIPIDESLQETFSLWYSGNPNTAGTFSYTVTFYAKDA